MTDIFSGRYTAATDEPFVVFLIGMRINKIWAVHKWMPVFMSMVPMIAKLMRHPEKGFLGGTTLFGWRAVTMIQYWRSFDDLERFARHPDDPHLPAWKRFNQSVGNDGTVGIWHETYLVEPDRYESVYGNMPRYGLGQVLEHVPATGRRHTARKRLQA